MELARDGNHLLKGSQIPCSIQPELPQPGAVKSKKHVALSVPKQHHCLAAAPHPEFVSLWCSRRDFSAPQGGSTVVQNWEGHQAADTAAAWATLLVGPATVYAAVNHFEYLTSAAYMQWCIQHVSKSRVY